MVLLNRFEGEAVFFRAIDDPPAGPAFDPSQAAAADRLEIWGTSFVEDMEFCEFRLYQGTTLLGVRRLPGF